MFSLNVVVYPDSKGIFLYNYLLSTKRLEVSYHAQIIENDLEYPEYTWKIDFLFKLIIQDEQRLQRTNLPYFFLFLLRWHCILEKSLAHVTTLWK